MLELWPPVKVLAPKKLGWRLRLLPEPMLKFCGLPVPVGLNAEIPEPHAAFASAGAAVVDNATAPNAIPPTTRPPPAARVSVEGLLGILCLAICAWPF